MVNLVHSIGAPPQNNGKLGVEDSGGERWGEGAGRPGRMISFSIRMTACPDPKLSVQNFPRADSK